MAAPTTMPEMARRALGRAPAAAGLGLEPVGDGAARLRCGCGGSRRRAACPRAAASRARQREGSGPERACGDDEWRQLPSSWVRTPRALPIRKLPAGTLTHRGRTGARRPGSPVTERGVLRVELDVRDPRSTSSSGAPPVRVVPAASTPTRRTHGSRCGSRSRRRRRWRRANGSGCSSGSGRWRGRPRPTRARRRATVSSPSNGCAPGWRTRCASIRRGGRPSPRSRRSEARLDAKRRQSARKQDRRRPDRDD